MQNWDDLKEGMLTEFCFVKFDISSHSKISKNNPKAKVTATLEKFEDYIDQYVSNFKGRLWFWEGDGGLAAFLGNDSTERSVACAMDIIKNLMEFNRYISQIDDDLNIRIAVHFGNAKYRSDNFGRIHSDDINYVSHLEDNVAFHNDICISEDAYKELSIIGKKQFKEIGIFQRKKVFSIKGKIRDKAIVHMDHRSLPNREESLNRYFHNQLRIFSTTADNYFIDSNILNIICDKLAHGCKVRVLLLDHDSIFFKDRENQEKTSFDERQIASIAILRKLKNKYPDNLDLCFFNIAPTYQALIIDDYIIFVAINIYGTRGTIDFPCLQIINGPETNDLFNKFTDAFEKLWNESKYGRRDDKI